MFKAYYLKLWQRLWLSYKNNTYMTSIIIETCFCSVYTPFHEDQASSGGQTFLFALINALIVVAIVVVMTVILVCLFKYRCYRVGLYVM